MGRLKRGHNWKARQSVKTEIDRTEESKLKVELACREENFDDSNVLVLPAKKRKTTIKSEQPVAKSLTKKRRKQLERIVDQREKKKKRAGLLESLQKVQASKDDLALLISTSDMQSQRHKIYGHSDRVVNGDQKQTTADGGGNLKHWHLKTELADNENSSAAESSDDSDSDFNSDSQNGDEADEEGGLAEPARTETPEKTDSLSLEEEKAEVKVRPETPVAKRIECEPAVHIALNRDPEVQAQRLYLPILPEEQVVMETIRENPVTIICGETGSGKTTQVPQFLYEAGYTQGGMICITEPRRVAAISMSRRVAHEMNLPTSIVSYQIRYEGNVTDSTLLKFVTDGVLLKEVQKDFMLSRYSVILIDEAHERSVYTDILIGLLSRIVPLRAKRGKPLKLIIMSATLRVEDFTENKRLFKVTPPIVKVEARQFPVTIHFNKHTHEDYLTEAFKKVCKIHTTLPDGGILVFVTGQQEVHSLCAKLKERFAQQTPNVGKRKSIEKKSSSSEKLPEISLNDYSSQPVDVEAEEKKAEDDLVKPTDDHTEDPEDESVSPPIFVLPLYSMLASRKQAKIFAPPPDGSRMCIITTNVAETSLTIPSMKYVVDTGKTKTKFYDKVTGVSTFRITWVSKASANQRAGRAGRTAPGHCYRLYSSAMFTDFEMFSPPEIVRRPVEDLVLQMKDMGIDKVMNFPFPTPPAEESLKAAEKLLISLGALQQLRKPKSSVKPVKKGCAAEPCSSVITGAGRAMACFAVSARYARMLTLGAQHGLLAYVIAVIASLSVQQLLHEPPPTDETDEDRLLRNRTLQQRRTWAATGNSLLLGDLSVLLKAVGACEYMGGTVAFCERHCVRHKAMLEVRKLRLQLTNQVNVVIPDANVSLDPKMPPPDDTQMRCLRQIVLAGVGDHVARRLPTATPGSEDAKKLKNAYQSTYLEDPVFIHPSSVLFREKPEYVMYQQIEETSKLYMKGVSAVEEEWLPVFAPTFCRFSKPLEEPAPTYCAATGGVLCHMTSTFGPHFWPLPSVESPFPENLDRYRWFAKFLLEGAVYRKLERFVPLLLSSPVTMTKSWAKLQPRTDRLLNGLVAKRIDNRQQLETVWSTTPDYLFVEICDWLPESEHPGLRAIWPPLNK